jgi:DNA-binding CsgD family transcriptional regulator
MQGFDLQSRFLLELYRAAGEQPAELFQDWALERLARDLPFDSAFWASAAATPAGLVGHTLHLYRQPAQLLIDYAPLADQDTMIAESLRNPGKTIRKVARDSAPPVFKPFLERYGLEQGMVTLQFEAEISVFNSISLYRADRNQPFSEDDAEFKQNVFPHLVEADSRNKLAHLTSGTRLGASSQWHSAAVDSVGVVRHAEGPFKLLAAREWPGWRGPYLPDPLRELLALGLASATSAAMPRCTVARLSHLGELTLVQLRERNAVDDLPERMRQVARLAAEGHSNKHIAAQMNISPNTVRNHLAEAYERLAVKNKAEMAGLVLRFEQDLTGDKAG